MVAKASQRCFESLSGDVSKGAGLACFVDAAGLCVILGLAAAVMYSNQSGGDSGNGVHRHRMHTRGTDTHGYTHQVHVHGMHAHRMHAHISTQTGCMYTGMCTHGAHTHRYMHIRCVRIGCKASWSILDA